MADTYSFTDSFGDKLEISTHPGCGVVLSSSDRRTTVDIAVLTPEIPALIAWLQAAQNRS